MIGMCVLRVELSWELHVADEKMAQCLLRSLIRACLSYEKTSYLSISISMNQCTPSPARAPPSAGTDVKSEIPGVKMC